MSLRYLPPLSFFVFYFAVQGSLVPAANSSSRIKPVSFTTVSNDIRRIGNKLEWGTKLQIARDIQYQKKVKTTFHYWQEAWDAYCPTSEVKMRSFWYANEAIKKIRSDNREQEYLKIDNWSCAFAPLHALLSEKTEKFQEKNQPYLEFKNYLPDMLPVIEEFAPYLQENLSEGQQSALDQKLKETDIAQKIPLFSFANCLGISALKKKIAESMVQFVFEKENKETLEGALEKSEIDELKKIKKGIILDSAIKHISTQHKNDNIISAYVSAASDERVFFTPDGPMSGRSYDYQKNMPELLKRFFGHHITKKNTYMFLIGTPNEGKIDIGLFKFKDLDYQKIYEFSSLREKTDDYIDKLSINTQSIRSITTTDDEKYGAIIKENAHSFLIDFFSFDNKKISLASQKTEITKKSRNGIRHSFFLPNSYNLVVLFTSGEASFIDFSAKKEHLISVYSMTFHIIDVAKVPEINQLIISYQNCAYPIFYDKKTRAVFVPREVSIIEKKEITARDIYYPQIVSHKTLPIVYAVRGQEIDVWDAKEAKRLQTLNVEDQLKDKTENIRAIMASDNPHTLIAVTDSATIFLATSPDLPYQ
jgi:hypothetical protein